MVKFNSLFSGIHLDSQFNLICRTACYFTLGLSTDVVGTTFETNTDMAFIMWIVPREATNVFSDGENVHFTGLLLLANSAENVSFVLVLDCAFNFLDSLPLDAFRYFVATLVTVRALWTISTKAILALTYLLLLC